MKLPAISIHAENLQLRTKVQMLETKLLQSHRDFQSLHKENGKLQGLLAEQILFNSALRGLLGR